MPTALFLSQQEKHEERVGKKAIKRTPNHGPNPTEERTNNEMRSGFRSKSAFSVGDLDA